MSKEAEYRGHAERARAIAGQLKAIEREKLLKIADEWDKCQWSDREGWLDQASARFAATRTKPAIVVTDG